MKKNLDLTGITNELKGASLYFQNAGQEPLTPIAEEANTRTAERSNDRTDEHPHARTGERENGRTPEQANERTPERTNDRTAERDPQKRQTKRYSFQFYKDQITQLKQLHARSLLAGQNKNLSDFVREAIDAYLAQRDDRTDEHPNG